MFYQFGSNFQAERGSMLLKTFSALRSVLIAAILMTVSAPEEIFAQSKAAGVLHRFADMPLQASAAPLAVPLAFSLAFPLIGSSLTQRGGVGYLGVYLGDVNEERAKQLKLTEARGAVVGKVEENSPAGKAGLQENDVILAFNEQQIQNRAQLYRLLIDSTPGNKVTLGISRNGEQRSLAVELGQRRGVFIDDRQTYYGEVDAMLAAAEDRRKEADDLKKKGDEEGARKALEEERDFRNQADEQRAFVESQIREGKIKLRQNSQNQLPNVNANRYYLGIITAPLSEQLSKFFNVTRGVLVSEVRAGGAAERAGIKAGDCIIAINNEPVFSASDMNRLIDRLNGDEAHSEKPGMEFFLTIVRDRNEQKIKVKIDQR